MLASGNGRSKMPRPEGWRGCQQHHVDAAVDDLLVGIETEKTRPGSNPDPVRKLLANVVETSVELVLEDVPQGREFHAAVRPQGFDGGAGSPSPATDQADFQERSIVRGIRRRGQLSGQRGPGPRRGRGKKPAACGCRANTAHGAIPFRCELPPTSGKRKRRVKAHRR